MDGLTGFPDAVKTVFSQTHIKLCIVQKTARRTDCNVVFSFQNHKFYIPGHECRGKKIILIISERMGFKAMLPSATSKVHEIKYCDFYDNTHIKTHMPEVTKLFIDKYLRLDTKANPYDTIVSKALV